MHYLNMQKFIWNAHVICEITISNSNLHIMIIEENQIFVSVSIFFFFFFVILFNKFLICINISSLIIAIDFMCINFKELYTRKEKFTYIFEA